MNLDKDIKNIYRFSQCDQRNMQEDNLEFLTLPKTANLVFAQQALPLNQADREKFLLKHQASIACFQQLPKNCPITRKIEFLAGRILLKDVIKKISNDEKTDMEVGFGANGMPLWPKGIVGSVTHTKSHVCVMVGLSKEYLAIGIDLEPLISSEKSQELRPVVLSERECSLYHQYTNIMPFNQFFTRCYSFKEAIYKLLFPQIKTFIDFKEIEVMSINQADNTISARYQSSITNQFSNGLFEGKSFNFNHGILSYIYLSNLK